MKKKVFWGLVVATLTLLPNTTLFAQSTEGTDFWLTLMRGDERKYDELSLTFSAKAATKVYVENTYTGYYDTVSVGDNEIQRLLLNSHESSCYVHDADEERVSNHALHVTSDKPISLIAANYKDKSFDVAAILPTPALMSEYRIQCYTPTAHENNEQGSHFAIVAADDDVVVDYILTENSDYGKRAGDTCTTDTLKKGQVWYVWSGQNKGRDFTGSIVKARNNKKIAVFNGNSHTNIPNAIRDRDHVYSQAMPINYWGKRFAITSSLTTIDGQTGYWERIDKIRVQALVDGTVVRIDGDSVYTFDFSKNPKHFYEFDFGAKDSKTGYTESSSMPYFEGASHYIETTCPSAVHLFMTSNRYDHAKVKNVNEKYCNGDPSLIWVNPIEQKIKTLTFGTFETQQVKDHFINIVTTADNKNSVELDGTNIADKFTVLKGDSDYVYARITNVANGTHTLSCDSGFIAHVYGFGQRESYGYPAGGETKDLTASITINGEVYKPGSDNTLCGDDKVLFNCDLNYDADSIYWSFGDQTDTTIYQKGASVEHYYSKATAYKAYVLIYRHFGEEDQCLNLSAYDSIAFHVNVGNYKVDTTRTLLPSCFNKGDEVDLRISLDNPSLVSLTGDSVRITFDATAKNDGFDEKDLKIEGDTVLIIRIPKDADDNKPYSLNLYIGSECPNSVLDKDFTFSLKFSKKLLEQRYNNILGLMKDSFPNKTLSDFVWLHDGDTIPDQTSSVLYLDETNPNNDGEYIVCYTIHEAGKPDKYDCTCPVAFKAESKTHEFEADAQNVEAAYKIEGNKIYVNADYKGETNIECYAQWITASGAVYQNRRYDIPDGGCTIETPAENGLYLLRVVTGKNARSFKFMINH
ncbi:MAG: IgGFc-binding protein [Paludibacteraceae bacterium]|nr:IgGFc-binding protein [Paludibacteraceae bacterium]